MIENRLLIAAVSVGVVIAATVILLVSGGSDGEDVVGGDPSQDVVVAEGGNPPSEVAMADIISADVRKEGATLIFEARMAGSVPQKLPDGSLELRWEILEGGSLTWLVTAEIADDPRASVLAQAGGFGASTIDSTLPGSITIGPDGIRVELRTDELTDWPEGFDWTLRSSLDGDRGDGASALATDSAPDNGTTRSED
jgi:hypothetical protein